MNRTPVNSSRIASIGWEANTLEVEFKRGGFVYQYSPVSEEMKNNLMNSSQVGVDMQAIIDNPDIQCKKL